MPDLFASADVQKQAGESETVGRVRDQSTSRSHSDAAGRAIGEREIPFAPKPRVQIDAAPERAEPVIGDNHQHVAFAQASEDLADERVVLLVEFTDRVSMLGRLPSSRRRMRRVEISPEHVLDAVSRIEHAHQRSAAESIEGGEEHRTPLAIDIVGLLEEVLHS